MTKRTLIKPAVAGVLGLLVAACDDTATLVTTTVSGAGGTADSATAAIRVIHASPDAPAVDVLLNGETAISGLDYATSSGFTTLDAGRYDIAVDGILPTGTANVINVEGLELEAGSQTTVMAVGKVAEIAPLIVTDSAATPTAEHVTLTVTHAAPEVPAVEIYLLAPDAVIDLHQPGIDLHYQQTLDLGAIAAEDVRIVAALDGTVAYDSGSIDLAPFAGQSLSVFAIASDTAAEQAASPVTLLVGTGEQTVELRDAATQSAARVAHLSPDARAVAHGPVEVFATATATGVSSELIDAFYYTDVVPAADSYVSVPAMQYRFDVAPDSDTVGDSIYTSPDISLATGSDYSVIAVGRISNTDPDNAFRLLAIEDNNRRIATQASLRVVHGAPSAGDVEVFVSPAGNVNAHALDTISPVLSEFAFADTSDALAIAPGHYDIRVVAGGAIAINAENIELTAGSVTTAIARGPIEGVHVAPQDVGLLVLSN